MIPEIKQFYHMYLLLKNTWNNTDNNILGFATITEMLTELPLLILACCGYIVMVVSFRLWWPYKKLIKKWIELENLEIMCEAYGQFIKTWWNPKKVKWDRKGIHALFKHCSQFKHIWEKDYIIWKLQQ